MGLIKAHIIIQLVLVGTIWSLRIHSIKDQHTVCVFCVNYLSSIHLTLYSILIGSKEGLSKATVLMFDRISDILPWKRKMAKMDAKIDRKSCLSL